MICVRKEDKVVNWTKQTIAVLEHDNFLAQEINAVLCWVNVVEEGVEVGIFEKGRTVACEEDEFLE